MDQFPQANEINYLDQHKRTIKAWTMYDWPILHLPLQLSRLSFRFTIRK